MRYNRMISLSGFMLVAGFAVVFSIGCEETGSLKTDSKQTADDHQVDPRIPPKTHYAAGRLLERRGDFEGAIRQYRRAIALSADYVDALNRLGITLDRLGRFDEADSALTEAIILEPGEAYLRNNLAFSYMLQRRWQDAEAELRNALVLDPDFERARVNLGLVLARQERFEDALTAFTLALPEADAYYNMGLIYREQDMFNEAQDAFSRSLVLDPSMEAARRQLESIEKRIAAIQTRRQVLKRLAKADRPAAPDPSDDVGLPTDTVAQSSAPSNAIVDAEFVDATSDDDCIEELLEQSPAEGMAPRVPSNPINQWDDAIAESEDGDWTVPIEHQSTAPHQLSLVTTLLLSEDVREIVRSAARDALAISTDSAFAEAGRRAVIQSMRLGPGDPYDDVRANKPSISAGEIPTARITRSSANRTAGELPSPSAILLDRITAVDGPIAGRVSLFGYPTLMGERPANSVRRVHEERQAALAKYREAETAPLAPHDRDTVNGPTDQLPNRPMTRTPGSCQCTDRWRDHLLPKE